MRRVRLPSIGALLLLSVCGGAARAADPAPPDGALLGILEAELARATAELKAKASPPPYFVSHLVTASDALRVSAAAGALRSGGGRSRSRRLDTEVRVGSPELDSSHPLRGERSFERLDVPLPLEDDADAIRNALWLETDRRYRAAADRFVRVKADVAVKVEAEDASADFSREEPRRFAGPLATVALDVPAWERRVRAYSGLLSAAPEVLDSGVSVVASATNEWFVSSEGTAVQHGRAHYRLSVFATAKADDGMVLQRNESFDAASPGGLPDDATVEKAVRQLLSDLRALRTAPVVEPYTGPAILTGRAAGVFFHEIFGHRIEGQRQKGEDEGQTFTKKVGQRVLPEFLSVADDPTLERAAGVDLNGHYLYDEEGVAARRVPVVEKGVLKGFLMSRAPVAGFPASNGHGRKQPGLRPAGRQGNLLVEASRTVSEARLRELLVEECRRQGKPFGLVFSDISGGFTMTGRYGPQSFQVTPIVVHRVYTDGRPDELVRGVDLIGTPLVSFGKILAASDRIEAFNGTCGAESGSVPVSAVAPGLLTGEIEVQKKAKSNDRPPLLPAPGRSGR